MRLRSLIAFAVMGALGSGCAHYRAQPLAPSAIETALAAPRLEAVRIAAGQISHPLLAPLAIDGRDGFTPDEIALMTVVASPQLRAARDQRGVAQAQVVQAGLLPNPQLGYSLDKLHPSEPDLINGESLGLSWDVTALLGYGDRVAGAKATAAALDLDLAWQEWQAAQAARLAAYRALSLMARLPLARATEAELADALALAKQARELGHNTTADVIAATEAWSLAQDERLALEQELATQQLALRLGLGLPADAPLTLKADAALPALPAGTDSAAALLDGLEKRRLDLVALTLGYESAEASLRATVKAQFPRIGINLARARDTSDVHTQTYGVSVDLPLFDRNQAQVAAGTATRQQLFDEYVARVAEARAEVSQILANLAAARTQFATLEAELPDLEAQVAALDRAMQTRNADAQAVRDAHGALLARRVEEAKMRQEILELGVALELATGRALLSRPAAN